MSNAKKARRKRRLRKVRRIGLAVVGLVAVVWMFYLAATWGPKPVDSGPVFTGDPESRELVERSQALEQQFEAVARYRAPNEEELGLLRQALDLQREHNLSRPPTVNDRRRLEALEARLGHFLAKELHERSLEAEREGERLAAEGEMTEALENVRTAYELQRKVNVEYGRGEFRDRHREARLQQQLASMEAAPLYERSVELEARADEAIADFRWREAGDLLAEARELQVRINNAERRSVYHNSGRIQALDRKKDSLQVGMKATDVKTFTAEGEALEEQSRWQEAAQAYERAMILQNEINRDHPQSPFVSREGAVALDAARQTALSASDGERLEATYERMRTALRTGELGRVATLAKEAGDLAARISEQFPRSRHVTADLRLELGFLSMAAPALPELQELLRGGLASIPGHPGLRISGDWVSQDLFSRVMNANPSRNRGIGLPVDSVTLRQAREFCRRASWILGEPVHLPEKAHVEALDAIESPESGETLRAWLGDSAENGGAWTVGWSEGAAVFQAVSGGNVREPDVGLRYVVGGEERREVSEGGNAHG